MNNTIAVNTGSEENSNIANITLNSPNFFPLISEVSKSHNQYCPVKDGIDGIHETTHHCLLENLSVDYGTQNHHKHLKLNQILIPKQRNMLQTLPTLKYDDTLNLELGVNLSMIDLNEKVGTEKKQHLSHICFEDIDSKCYAYSSSTYQNNSQISSKSLIKAHSHNSFLTNHTYSKTECCMGHFLNERTSIAHLAMTEEWSKKSQNMTECVPVPSSEHVAEIVGRQGCKIKALRAKTNTYIKTPVRNEEPVFVVTGRKEDVTKAKREILSAAEHFTLIRATRRGEANVAIVKNGYIGKNSSMENLNLITKDSFSSIEATQSQMTIQVRVPYRVVGLVVGPKGNTIKHIQQETQTYIVTPSRDKEPIFEITGLKYNVQAARKHIETHIATRTMGTNSVSNLRRESSTTSKNTHLEVNISLPKSSAGEQFNIDCTNNRNSMHQINNQVTEQICVNDPKTTIGMITENVIKYPLKPENAKTRLLSSLKSTVPLKSKFSNISPLPSNDFNLLSIMHRKDTCLSAFNSLNINDKSNVHVECLPNNFNTTYEYFQQTSNNELEESSVTRDILKSNLCDSEVNIIRKQEFIATNNQNIDVNKSQDTQHNNILDNPVNFSVPLLDTFDDFEQHSLHLVSAPAFKVFKTYVPNTFNARGVIGCFENATNINILTRPCSSASSNASTSSRSLSQYSNGTAVGPYEKKSTPYQNVLDIDEGFGESPTVRKLPKKLAVIKCSYYPNSISPSDSSYINYSEMRTNPIIIHRPIEHTSKTHIKRDCCICHEKDMVAALIPCGHKMFCVDCANTICASKKPICPFCCMKVYQAIKILN